MNKIHRNKIYQIQWQEGATPEGVLRTHERWILPHQPSPSTASKKSRFPSLPPGELIAGKGASLPSCDSVSLMPPTHNHPVDSVLFPVKPPSPICWQSSISQETLEAPACDRTHPALNKHFWIQDQEITAPSPSPGVRRSAKLATSRSADLTLLCPRLPKLSKPQNPPFSQYQLCPTKFPERM